MENEFMKTLKMFVNELHTNFYTEETKKFLDIFDKINSSKIIKRVYDFLLPLKKDILNKNSNIFKIEQFILPEIDLSKFWNNLDEIKRNNIWIYLQMLSITSSSICNTSNFNPYIGIEGGNITVDSLCKEMATNSSMKDNVGIKSLVNMILQQVGVKNPEEFVGNFINEIKDIKPETVEKTVNELNEHMGIEGTENKEFLRKIITALPNEIKNIDFEKESFNGIIKIAQNIMENVIKPDLENGKINVGELLNLQNNLMKKMNKDIKLDDKKTKDANEMLKKMTSMLPPELFSNGESIPTEIPEEILNSFGKKIDVKEDIKKNNKEINKTNSKRKNKKRKHKHA